jgi:hypothetical protein
VRDVEDPSLIRISIGGSLSLAGGFHATDGVVGPADVTPASGVVAYRLYTERGRFGPGVGLAIVEMPADDRIRIETSAGAATTASFTDAASIHVR